MARMKSTLKMSVGLLLLSASGTLYAIGGETQEMTYTRVESTGHKAAPAKPDLGLRAVYKMPAVISLVSQVCPWRSKRARGNIRLVRTEQQGVHQLYVQWMRQGGKNGKGGDEAVSTIAILELNQETYYRFEMPQGRLIPGACELKAELVDVRNQRQFSMTLYLKGAGKYQYQITRKLLGGE